MSLDLTTVKTIYRQAIDERAHDAEGDAWWAEVAAEIQAVVAAPGAAAASASSPGGTTTDPRSAIPRRMPRAACGRRLRRPSANIESEST